ncbi:glutamine amidotransferase [Gordonia alkaliphila]|uniref:type 1 glutamine amidotransferase n=1 Tax=Gordonia alkaliphila TaxID=1053547 RepID=UPI001FF1DFF7|nr:glutamine amidotransferase [Gordonia alkaliphila]MCK0439231.1 glutamine amidotransferase [Gordonia alkaliphila]
MSESTLRIGLVLPDVMGTYGDGGNALVLRQRARMRGIEAEIVQITLDDDVPDSLDVYTLGGAEDFAQRLATRHLTKHAGMQRAAAAGRPVLAICAAIQVLGHWYETAAGERVDGVGLFDATTSPMAERAIGELVTAPLVDGLTQPLTGFENHRGATSLGADARPLGTVRHGTGNALGGGVEGVVQGSVLGTYMHGPLLARNPELADYLLAQATGAPLAPLELPEVDRLRRERLAAAR